MSTIFTSTHNSYKWLKYYFNIIFIPIIIFSLTSSNIHLVCFALQLRNPSVSSMGWKWCYGNENVKNAMGKTATLPNAAHVLVYFFVGTAPLTTWNCRIWPSHRQRKKPTTTFSFVQFVELEYIYYEFNSRRVRLSLTEASSSLFFFLRFGKKKIRVFM